MMGSKNLGKGILVLAVIAAATQARPGWTKESFTYDHVLTTPKGTFVTKVWIKGDRKRTESGDGPGKKTVIVHGNTYYEIHADKGIVQKMALGGGEAGLPGRSGTPQNWEEETTPQNAPVGTAEIAGLPCRIFEWRGDKKSVTKIWISDELPFPLRWEEWDAKEGKFSYAVENLQRGLTLSDSLFAIPKGLKVIESRSGVFSP